ncbi:MAG: urease accessory protein UreF [Rubricella sp.]
MTDLAVLQKLQTWLSPSFPVGAFSWSHGLETAMADGRVDSAGALEDWVRAVLEHGSGWTDAVLMAHTMKGEDVAELAEALAPTRERHAETMEQGAAFARTVNAVEGWHIATSPYPIAFADAARRLGADPATAITLHLQAFAANLISAGVRLIPLGQTEGQRITTALHAACADLTRRALDAPLDAIGGAGILSDIAAMRHETLATRVFRS